MSDVYPYDHSFQLSLIALAFREPRFATDYNFLLSPIYFDNDDHRHLVRVLSDFTSRFGKNPDSSIFHDLIRAYARSKHMEEAVCLRLEDTLDKALSMELVDVEWIREEAIRFARGQLMKSAIVNAYNSYTNIDDYTKIADEFQKIIELDAPASRVLKFSDIAQEIPNQFRAESPTAIQGRVPTGLPTLDAHMFGGAARGKLGVVMAPSGGGKTHLLTFLGAQAVKQGFVVHHYAFGDMNEWEVALRYAANFTGISSYDVIRGINRDYHSSILDWLNGAASDLFISSYPPDTITAGNLKSIISSLVSRSGVKPAVIIVDYADNLHLGSKQNLDPSHTNAAMGSVYKQLIKIGAQFDAVVYTGSQVQRSFYRISAQSSGEVQGARYVPGLIDTSAVAQAIQKIDQAEYIFTLNQSSQENDLGIARIYEAKIRFGSDKHIVTVRFDKSTSSFKETGEVIDTSEEYSHPRRGNSSVRASPVVVPVDLDRERIASIINTPHSLRIL